MSFIRNATKSNCCVCMKIFNLKIVHSDISAYVESANISKYSLTDVNKIDYKQKPG